VQSIQDPLESPDVCKLFGKFVMLKWSNLRIKKFTIYHYSGLLTKWIVIFLFPKSSVSSFRISRAKRCCNDCGGTDCMVIALWDIGRCSHWECNFRYCLRILARMEWNKECRLIVRTKQLDMGTILTRNEVVIHTLQLVSCLQQRSLHCRIQLGIQHFRECSRLSLENSTNCRPEDSHLPSNGTILK
jgi:hypothetical protein